MSFHCSCLVTPVRHPNGLRKDVATDEQKGLGTEAAGHTGENGETPVTWMSCWKLGSMVRSSGSKPPYTPCISRWNNIGRLTWNLQIIHLEREMIWTKPQGNYVPAVNLQGCRWNGETPVKCHHIGFHQRFSFWKMKLKSPKATVDGNQKSGEKTTWDV